MERAALGAAAEAGERRGGPEPEPRAPRPVLGTSREGEDIGTSREDESEEVEARRMLGTAPHRAAKHNAMQRNSLSRASSAPAEEPPPVPEPTPYPKLNRFGYGVGGGYGLDPALPLEGHCEGGATIC